MDNLVRVWLRLAGIPHYSVLGSYVSVIFFLLHKAGVFLCLQAVFGSHVIGIGCNHIYRFYKMYL